MAPKVVTSLELLPMRFVQKIGVPLAAALVFGCSFPGCASHSSRMKIDPVDAYAQAQKTKLGADFPVGSAAEKAAVARFQNFFGHLTEENARSLTRETYAEDVFFFDTLKEINGLEALEEYFVETARNTDSVRAEVVDWARSGQDFYVRWTMDIQLKKFRRGETLRSVGMTHLRFNQEGKIILHHDFWDSTRGFYQHVPVLGGVLRWIQSKF
jgi:hypothetical protein